MNNKVKILVITFMMLGLIGCSESSSDSSHDIKDNNSSSSVDSDVNSIEVDIPESIPDVYKRNTAEPESRTDNRFSNEEKTSTTTTTTAVDDDSSLIGNRVTQSPVKTNVKYPLYYNKNGIHYYDLYEGPHDWEGLGLKFTSPKGTYLTIVDNIPILYTLDFDDADKWPTVLNGIYYFWPYYLMKMEIDFDKLDAKQCERLVEREFDDKTQFDKESAVFEDMGYYKLYTYIKPKACGGEDAVITNCYMKNRSMIKVQLKPDSDYEKEYKDDLKSIVDSFEYSEIDYIP